MIARAHFSNGFQKTVHSLMQKEGAKLVYVQNLFGYGDLNTATEIMQFGTEDAISKSPLYHLKVIWEEPVDGGYSIERDSMTHVAERIVRRLLLVEHEVIGVGYIEKSHSTMSLIVNRMHPDYQDGISPVDGKEYGIWNIRTAGLRIRRELRYFEDLGGYSHQWWKRRYRFLRPAKRQGQWDVIDGSIGLRWDGMEEFVVITPWQRTSSEVTLGTDREILKTRKKR